MVPVSTEVEESRESSEWLRKAAAWAVSGFTETNVKQWDYWQIIQKINVHWDLYCGFVRQLNKTWEVQYSDLFFLVVEGIIWKVG